MNQKSSEHYYRTYSNYLAKKYHEKVYKLPINLPITCPNRDGQKGYGGCIFCSEKGTGFESQENQLSVGEQLYNNKLLISKKYKANKFIAYFQNYTNTYMPLEQFKAYIEAAIIKDVVGLSISTRPDCITDEQLDYLSNIQSTYHVDIDIELGLQTTNDHTLAWLNRGHDVQAFKDAFNRIRKYPFQICVHLIANLPPDTMKDIEDMVVLINTYRPDFVKIHSLYIAEGTVLGDMYLANQLDIISKEAYIERMIFILTHVDPDIVFQRLFARAPEADTLFCNWQTSWRKLHNTLLETMEERHLYQGIHRGATNE